jgi:hypothetical protein
MSPNSAQHPDDPTLFAWVVRAIAQVMNDAVSNQAIVGAAARIFRTYERHCVSGDEDAFFDLLSALHSFADKIKLTRPNLNSSQNFLALRGLRNLFHHEAELLHAMRWAQAVDVPQISTDLSLLCLVPRTSIDRALERAREETEREAIKSAFHWYGSAVNVEPAIFNAMVDAYELIKGKGIDVPGDSFTRFDNQYRWETTSGHSHRVTGKLYTHAGSIDALLNSLLTAPV